MTIFPICYYHRHHYPFGQNFDDRFNALNSICHYKRPPRTMLVFPKIHQSLNQQQKLTNGKTNENIKGAYHGRNFRIGLNVDGFDVETIKTEVHDGKLIIQAKQDNRQVDGDYNIRKLRKSYTLPEHADVTHLVSYITRNKILVIEVPIKNPEIEHLVAETNQINQSLAQFGSYLDPVFNYMNFLNSPDFDLKVIDKGENKKQLEMSLDMKTYKPEEIKISVKNNELTVKSERTLKDEHSIERTLLFKTIKLPPGAQIEQLQSYLNENGQLKIEAPFIELTEPFTSEPHDSTN